MSRLSDLLSDLSRDKRMNQPQIVKRSNELGVPLSKGNVSRYLSGKHPERPQRSTLEAFAKVLDVPVADLEAAARYTGREPFEADPTSDQLTAPQRAAVNEIIRLLADGNRGARDESQQGQSPTQPQHRSTDSSEDGSETGRPGAPMSDFPTFGTPRGVGDLGDGPLDPANTLTPDELARRRTLNERYPNPETPAPPARGDAAAFEPRHGSEGVRQSEEAEKRGEENQDEGDE